MYLKHIIFTEKVQCEGRRSIVGPQTYTVPHNNHNNEID